jgi:hypothetical protein
LCKARRKSSRTQLSDEGKTEQAIPFPVIPVTSLTWRNGTFKSDTFEPAYRHAVA